MYAIILNFIVVTGGTDDRKVNDKIYQLDTKTNSWLEVAGMTTPRVGHGLSVIKYSKVEGLCPEIGKEIYSVQFHTRHL